ncbi:MAG: hypothetical protein WCK27_10495 [Verrucomicrobiota bacterium]
MKTLLLKELRENVKVAALGLVIYTLLLLGQYSRPGQSPRDLGRLLTDGDFLTSTTWFCGLFGAVLGWLQIHNERRPDLWAFLCHRPITRTAIFLAKATAGLCLYVLAAGLPLLGYIVWARLPGHVAAPFEWLMVRPAATWFLAGSVCYFAGMLTGLRQARWYASRGLGLGVAVIVFVALIETTAFWQGLAILFLAAAILITAVWSGFGSDGYYEGQPVWGKAALTGILLAGSVVVATAAGRFLTNLVPRRDTSYTKSVYAMSQTGAVFRATVKVVGPAEKMRFMAEPLLGAGIGLVTNRAEFYTQCAKGNKFDVDHDDRPHPSAWMSADCSLFSLWAMTPDEVWYYWDRYGRLVGYDRTTRRFIGSLGPKGFALDVAGGGDRFNNRTGGRHHETLATDTIVFLVDVARRTVKPLFSTAVDDPILAVAEVSFDNRNWEFTAVVTKKAIHLLTREGKQVWETPYEPGYPDYAKIDVYFLEPPGQYGLMLSPSIPSNTRVKGKLPAHVSWLAGDRGVVRSVDLPDLPAARIVSGESKLVMGAVMPPPLMAMMRLSTRDSAPEEFPQNMLLVSGAVAVLVCLPVSLWFGRRNRFSLGAQVGWALFHLVCGVPGLLAFLSVQEWPAREACPNCKKLRVVDHAQCEHCGAPFAPPEKTGTEVFAPLGAKVEAQAVG